MYLPALARDLYKSQKVVEKIEQQLRKAPDMELQSQLKDALRQAKAELAQLQKLMEGSKERSKASLNKPKYRF
ncbi:hypothetical protein UWK_01123 [Desulfocapsa sulfexigens DSM 10523]|uniref:Uncharacterized protein n=1 Tax=Desulfocapsa sulfexigens (strain DSM 10523 / SB164P1) TaxID=1167006 RepID=M1PML6_DESSD|nr:hypothetical protein [Desulfocapsa sulfexigens]AGF77691.1 hypothetical protein UWK_01123 [Desulfocapsa sulfexigens DSM 10523]